MVDGAAGSWTEKEFDQLSWHDNHVHGISLREGEGELGSGELILDLDFILEWKQYKSGFKFRIAPAWLTFHDVTSLAIDLDYAGFEMGPFSLDGIKRGAAHYEGFPHAPWSIAVNWPKGQISFDAIGFTQRLRGTPRDCDHQSLSHGDR